MAIVFIVQQLSQPRCIKRIKSFYDAGFPIKVYGFDTGVYSDNIKNIDFPIERIIKRSRYDSTFKKVWLFIKTIRQIVKENSKDDVFYCFGFHMGLPMRFFCNRKFIYEKADLQYGDDKGGVPKLFIWADKKIIKKSLLTVFTSQGFVDFLFPKEKPTNIILVPNKLNQFFINKEKLRHTHPVNDKHLKFGFVGLIRFKNTIIRFANIIGRYFPQHEFHFYGDPEREDYITDEMRLFKNVFLHGPFKNPVDLEAIYSNIDLNVLCYDDADIGVRIAEPNKYYESTFFAVPLVVSQNTYTAQRVTHDETGFIINAQTDQTIIDFVTHLNNEMIFKAQENCLAISSDDLIYNENELLERVKSLIGK